MTFGVHYSQAMLQAQFDAIADLFEPEFCWFAWVFDMQYEERFTQWTWKGRKEVVQRHWDNDINYRRRKVRYTRHKTYLAIHAQDNFAADWHGRFVGFRVWLRENDSEPLFTGPVRVNSTWITPGSSINMPSDCIIDMKGLARL